VLCSEVGIKLDLDEQVKIYKNEKAKGNRMTSKKDHSD
jgi:hypothetical protein